MKGEGREEGGKRKEWVKVTAKRKMEHTKRGEKYITTRGRITGQLKKEDRDDAEDL